MPKAFINKGNLITGVLLIALFAGLPAQAGSPGHAFSGPGDPNEQAHPDQEGLDIGEVIIGHVVDDYSWHIATIGSTHITIPLPVLLYSPERGFFFFWSSRFDHGHSNYKRFKIAQEGPNKGSIVTLDEQGKVMEQQPLDFSITKNVAAIFFSIVLMLILFIYIARIYRERKNKPPKGIQSLLEPLILFIRDEVARKSIGEEDYERFTPFLLTMFFFILINNLLGLIPIFPAGANVTGNISVTLALALFTFIAMQVSGKKEYWQEIFNPPNIPWWLKIPIPLVPVIEFVGIFIKPFVLAVRLFANISAGHIVMLGFLSLIFIFGNMNVYAGYGVSVFSVLFVVFITFLEILVAFIQAYVFTILSAIYFGMALGHE
ncbi:MAG: F0F1 ATP synthase subunit A [Bacteroidales bacterium]|nr:F0F1 ATP synthase subunit A [Bacteroidales bacterium]